MTKIARFVFETAKPFFCAGLAEGRKLGLDNTGANAIAGSPAAVVPKLLSAKPVALIYATRGTLPRSPP